MDTDAYTCGTCKHGKIRGACRQCEDLADKADAAFAAYKAAHHKRNDAGALAAQIKQPNNGDFV